MTLKLPDIAYKRILSHAQTAYPEEAAGFLLGCIEAETRTVEAALPQENRFEAGQRRTRYQIDAHAMMQAELYAEENGYEILGIYHSHPDHPAEPSSFDLEWSLPWFSYLITSVLDGEAKLSRCWRLNEDRTGFDEEAIERLLNDKPER